MSLPDPAGRLPTSRALQRRHEAAASVPISAKLTGSPGNPSPVMREAGHTFALQDFEAHANGARQNNIRGDAVGDPHRQNPRQPAVRGFEHHKDDQPDTGDAQPEDQQALP